MPPVAFDTLSTARDLESAGFDPRQAEAITAVMRDAVAEGISTKADIEDVRSDIEGAKTAVRGDIAEAKVELGDKTDRVDATLRDKIEQGDAALRDKIDEAKTELSDKIERGDAALGDKIDRVDATLGDKIDRVDATLGDKIDRVDATLGDKIDRVDATLRDKIDEAKTELSDKIEQGDAALGDKIDKLADDVSGMKTDLAATDERLSALARNSVTKAEFAALEGRMYRALWWFGGGIIATLVGLAGIVAAFVTLVLGAG